LLGKKITRQTLVSSEENCSHFILGEYCENHYKYIIERVAHETLNLNCQFNCCFNIFDFN